MNLDALVLSLIVTYYSIIIITRVITWVWYVARRPGARELPSDERLEFRRWTCRQGSPNTDSQTSSFLWPACRSIPVTPFEPAPIKTLHIRNNQPKRCIFFQYLACLGTDDCTWWRAKSMVEIGWLLTATPFKYVERSTPEPVWEWGEERGMCMPFYPCTPLLWQPQAGPPWDTLAFQGPTRALSWLQTIG